MKSLTLTFAALSLLGSTGHAQSPQLDSPAPVAPAAVSLTRTDEQLETLLGPIALYPDALIALILPASTVPSDLVLAARFIDANGRNVSVENEAWDDSVKSLAHYPEIIKWMDENLAWTKQLGDSFASQPTDVMKAVQRLRTRARAAGTLQDTPQQKVAVEGSVIAIEPAQPDVIYVPRYDPDVVYVERPYGYSSDAFLTFGIGFPVLAGWDYRCDWRRRSIWVNPGRNHPVWPYGPNLRPSPVGHVWVPPSRHFQSVGLTSHAGYPDRREVPQPRPFGRSVTDDAARNRNEHSYRPWNRVPEASVAPTRRADAPFQQERSRTVAPTPQSVPSLTQVPTVTNVPSVTNIPSVTNVPTSDHPRFRERTGGEARDAGQGRGRFVPPVAAPTSTSGGSTPANNVNPGQRTFVPHHVQQPSAPAATAPAPTITRAVAPPPQTRAAAPAASVPQPAASSTTPAPAPSGGSGGGGGGRGHNQP